MSFNAFSNYEIKEPNSLPACKDETLRRARELVNTSSTLCFDLCTSKIPQMKKIKIRHKGNKFFLLFNALQISITNCKSGLKYLDSKVFKKENT